MTTEEVYLNLHYFSLWKENKYSLMLVLCKEKIDVFEKS